MRFRFHRFWFQQHHRLPSWRLHVQCGDARCPTSCFLVQVVKATCGQSHTRSKPQVVKATAVLVSGPWSLLSYTLTVWMPGRRINCSRSSSGCSFARISSHKSPGRFSSKTTQGWLAWPCLSTKRSQRISLRGLVIGLSFLRACTRFFHDAFLPKFLYFSPPEQGLDEQGDCDTEQCRRGFVPRTLCVLAVTGLVMNPGQALESSSVDCFPPSPPKRHELSQRQVPIMPSVSFWLA